jgi:hypothetical protein
MRRRDRIRHSPERNGIQPLPRTTGFGQTWRPASAYLLPRLRRGDDVLVETSDGQTHRFVVRHHAGVQESQLPPTWCTDRRRWLHFG